MTSGVRTIALPVRISIISAPNKKNFDPIRLLSIRLINQTSLFIDEGLDITLHSNKSFYAFLKVHDNGALLDFAALLVGNDHSSLRLDSTGGRVSL